MILRVRYYRIPAGRNEGWIAVFGEWPERVLRHRGWTPERQVHERYATEEEHQWISRCRRFQAIHYATTTDLLADAEQVLADWPETLKLLCQVLGETRP